MGLLFRTRLRRDRVQVSVWIVSIALLAFATVSAVPSAYGDEKQRIALIEVILATPALRAIRGIPDGPGLGQFAFMEIFTYLALLAGLMSTFLVVRHTRQDEERGRVELLLAPRTAPLVATLVHATIANVVLAIVVTGVFVAGRLDLTGSALTGAAVGATGLAFAGIAALVVQLAPTSRAANGASAAVVGIAFLLRAAGDALGTPHGLTATSAWPSWLSPIGWGQQTFPFTKQDGWPLLLSVGVAVVASGVALGVQSRRDLGSSLVRERPGRASGTLRTTLGLAWRLHGSSVIGWAIGGAVFGVFAGALSGLATDALGRDASVKQLLATFVPGGHGALTDTFVAAIVSIAGVLAAAAGAQAILRARADELDGRADLLLAAPVSRSRWLIEWIVVGVASATSVVLATGVVAGLCFLASGEHRFWSSIGAGLAQLPAALVYVALAALLFALVPRVSTVATWVLLAIGLAFGQFGGLLKLPDSIRDLSPFTHTPGAPAASVDWSGAWWLVGVAIVGGVIAILTMRRRELS